MTIWRPTRPVAPLTILAVTSELPWPLDTGGHLRTFHLLSALARHNRVRLLTGAPKGASTAALRDCGVQVDVLHDGSRTARSEAARLLTAAVHREPYVMYRRHLWRAISDAVDREMAARPPDVLYLDHLDSFVYAPATTRCAVVADLHNVYSLLAERAADEQRRTLSRWYVRRQARRLARTEARVVRRADLVMAVSHAEARYYQSAGAATTHVVPNGVDCARYEQLPDGRVGGTPTILYIGAMSWRPNAAAAHFLANEVFPLVRRRVPGAQLRIVGRDPSPDVTHLAQQDGVDVTGRVEDVVPQLRDAHVLAVPLEAGGGTRLKILEAFAAGLPVVSTPVGVEGIDAEDGVHLAIRSREQFAAALIDRLLNPDDGRRMAVAARRLARSVYDWHIVGASASAAIQDAVHRRHAAEQSGYAYAV